MNVILDGNIYDMFGKDEVACSVAKRLIETGKLIIIVTRTVSEELARSPFGGIPNFFHTAYCGNTVARVGIIAAGDSIGTGQAFEIHLGESSQVSDALIADAASWKADILVSEDRRMLRRLPQTGTKCLAMRYVEFLDWMQSEWANTPAMHPDGGSTAAGDHPNRLLDGQPR